MKVYIGFHDKRLKRKRRSIAIGIFDGVHKGHQRILKSVMASVAKHPGVSTMAVTFDPHPSTVLMPRRHHPTILMSLEHRMRFFERMGLSETLVIPFDKRCSRIPAGVFLEKLLLEKLGMEFLAVGGDFRFGHKARGDAAFLARESGRLGFALSLVRPQKDGARVISSTRIRRAIESGRLRTARRMLGRPVSVYGTVEHGHKRGRSLGFPTANLNPHHETLPPCGVYAAWGYLDARKLRGIIHIGARPTFREKNKSLEVHFLDFHEDIYGRELELMFVSKIRPIHRFRTVRALTEAIHRDARKALKILA